MAEAPNSFGSIEVDEPTLPYTRKEIDRLRRGVRPASLPPVGEGTVRFEVVATSSEAPEAGPVEVEEEDWFMFGGRRIHVSLEALAHIGLSGGHPGMITCRQATLVWGEIHREGDAPSVPMARFTTVQPLIDSPANEDEPTARVEVDDDELLEYTRRGRWRFWWVGGGLAAVALVFGLRAGLSSDEPVIPEEEVEAALAEPIVVPVPSDPSPPRLLSPQPLVVAEAPPSPQPLIPDPVPASDTKKNKPRNEANTPACLAHRRDAEAALLGGDWVELEKLSKRTKCWPKSSTSKALCMRALFELERYEECVELSKNDRSKEVGKWQKTCSRALQ